LISNPGELTMPFAAGLSPLENTRQAFEQACDDALGRLPKPELALVFFSPHHLAEIGDVAPEMAKRFGAKTLIGCVGESIAGGGQEIENTAAVSVWLAGWDGRVQIEPFHLSVEQTPDGWTLLGWPDSVLDADPTQSAMLVLGDPYTFPADKLFLPRINEDHAGLRVIGGMASGMPGPGHDSLLKDADVLNEGAIGVLLRGPVKIRSIVSQGCRPVGKPLVVTKCQDNVIQGLGGKTPVEQLREIWADLPQHDRDLFQRGPHIGLVFNEYQEKFDRGDFLVRNIAGLDSNTGAIAVMDYVRVGQTVQFHVRDAEAADEDLHALLKRDREKNGGASGALLFTCNGRGSRLFGQPNHDAAAVQSEGGQIPLAGMFCAGELGPVGGRNFIHGFTASIALFED
jgi:small ligand-binding sensory domain FIST